MKGAAEPTCLVAAESLHCLLMHYHNLAFCCQVPQKLQVDATAAAVAVDTA